eukprot:scaffold3581_cov417-Prasinococcus_capsulatus_cf.AAC.15
MRSCPPINSLRRRGHELQCAAGGPAPSTSRIKPMNLVNCCQWELSNCRATSSLWGECRRYQCQRTTHWTGALARPHPKVATDATPMPMAIFPHSPFLLRPGAATPCTETPRQMNPIPKKILDTRKGRQ